ncbi:MAG: DUF2231 domain-containing protein [Dehalococcoidia bacterium]
MPSSPLRRLLRPLLDPPDALDPTAIEGQRLVRRALAALPAARQVRAFLDGSWFGHALHPALTDVPSGSWTLACLFDAADVLGMHRFRAAADASIAVGLLAVPVTAAAGAVDWSGIEGGRSRRRGLVHAALNIVASAAYLGSLVERCRGHRGSGRAWSIAGYVVMTVAAYLGGELVFGDPDPEPREDADPAAPTPPPMPDAPTV